MTQTQITPQPADDRKGTVVVSDYPNVRIHTYVSPPDGFLVNTQIVEGETSLVIFDGQLLNVYAAEVAAYASRLGKPVEQIIVSHGHPDHWAGLEVPVHSGHQRVHSSRRKERLHEGCLQNISTATSCGCVSALSQHNSDEVDKVGYYQKTTHHTRNLPVPDQSQERQVDHDHDR
jgi:metal-dependent hydrolase (beta-lactamase superfamily II)